MLLLVRPGLDPARVRPLPLLIGAWIAFIAAAWLLRKVPRRTSVALILLGGIAIQAVAVSAPPQNSNDLYRYIWDGRVQAAGIDPYQYVPTATQLTGLRNEFLFYPKRRVLRLAVLRRAATRPPNSPRAARGSTGRPCRPSTRRSPRRTSSGCYYLHPADDSSTPIQATTALAAVLTTVLLLFGLGRLGRDIRMAALWSWCPTVVLEAGNSAHVDVIAVGITAAAILLLATARTTRRTILGGILLGLAIATKLTPVLTVPALLRRRWVTVALAAGGAFIVVYVPHVLRVGGKVIGFLPGYLQQENYTKGTRFGIIGLFVTGPLAMRGGGAHPGRGRPRRAAVLRPRPALAGRPRDDRGRARRRHAALPVVLAAAGHAGRPRRPPGVAGVRRGRVLRGRAGPWAGTPFPGVCTTPSPTACPCWWWPPAG